MTVLEVLQSSASYFAKHGVESGRLNSEHLLAHVLGCKRLDLYLMFDRPVGEPELAPLRDFVRRRAKGEPLQHLLGTAEFHGRTFSIDARALIPRPETEQLVGLVLDDLKNHPPAAAPLRIADVGTGSGVIALTLAAELPAAQVDAFDCSEAALSLARENAARLGLDGRVHFLQSDLLRAGGDPYTLIVANLPYIATDVLPTLSPEVQRDPQLALDGGPAGLDFIERLITDAPRHLQPAGRIALEVGHDQAAAVTQLASGAGYRDVRALRDYQGIDRFVFATHG